MNLKVECLFLTEFESVNFEKLQQLRMIDPTMKSVCDILKTAKHLKRIRIRKVTDEKMLTQNLY